MNESQIKTLYVLLDMFSKRYPNKSPESVKATLAESLKMLSEVKPLTHSEQVEQDSCQLFNTGRFNDILLAYLVVAMRTADTPHGEAMKLLDTFNHTLDEMTAEQVLERYRGGIQ